MQIQIKYKNTIASAIVFKYKYKYKYNCSSSRCLEVRGDAEGRKERGPKEDREKNKERGSSYLPWGAGNDNVLRLLSVEGSLFSAKFITANGALALNNVFNRFLSLCFSLSSSSF